jgi:hypothetical protein
MIASLLFVGIQVRQNTDATRVSNAQSALQLWSDQAMAIATNETLASAYLDKIDPEFANTTLDDMRVNMWLSASLRSVESDYLQWLEGNVSDELWFSHRRTLANTYAINLGMQSYWKITGPTRSPQFRELMKEISTEADINKAGLRASINKAGLRASQEATTD